MKQLFCFCLLIMNVTVVAQQPLNGKLTIRALTDSAKPLEGATATLLRVKDGQLIRSSITDKSGEAVFERVAAGEYKVKLTMVGMEPAETEKFPMEQPLLTLPPVTLKAGKAAALEAVTVTGKKPFIQRLSDRIVVNVENSIVSAGSSALEVLERSPGITVDQNDQISLRGRAGVIIMIDGKRTALSGGDLANYLRGLPANAIDRIDIITNPSAKYDAAGNSGIIDIHLKKDQRLGANGSFTAGYGQGVYPKANTGTTFNYRNKSVNIFGNYNYAHRVNLNNLILDRNFFTNGQFSGQDKKNNYSKMPVNSHAARLGADFFAGKKTIIGFVVNSNFTHFSRDNNNSSLVIDRLKQPSFTFRTKATNNDHNSNTVGNINVKHAFDSIGREFTADVDYGIFSSNSVSSTATRYYKLDGSTQQPDYILNGDQEGRLKLRTGKFDYVHPLKNGLRISVGAKTSYVSSDNDAKFFDTSDGVAKNDTTKTNHFIYQEGNNAAYVSVNRQFRKFDLQFGLRGEQANIQTYQVKGDVKWDSGYFQLFPSAFLNYKLKEDQSVGLSVSRRIDRPGYSDLNPFLFLIDVSTYATGRPGLLPQLTWSYELNYTIKNLNFTFSYSHTKDVQNIAIVRFSDVFPNIQLPDPNITVQIPVNLESSNYFGVSISAPVRVTKWWNMVNNADIYYNQFNANLAATNLSNGAPAADVRTNNSFSFNKGWVAELNGSFNSGGRYGYMVSDPRWGISAGVQKSVMKNQGTLRFNITDIFWTNLPQATITYNNYIEYWHAYRESRVANLSFSYRFGNNKVAAARRRTTASEEERRRAGAN
jgi:iron complex outermembrane recepter protein